MNRDMYIQNGVWDIILRDRMSRKMEKFISMVSHELKSPLAAIRLLADTLLQQESVSGEMYREFLNDIIHEADRGVSIIDDLHMMAELEEKGNRTKNLSMVNADVTSIIERQIRNFQRDAEQNNITVKFYSYQRKLITDEGILSFVIKNLLENAIKYNRPGGWVEITLYQDEKDFCLKVEDSGVGIDESEREKIFIPFYRIKEKNNDSVPGTGLGLAIVDEAVRCLNGRIEVSGEKGKGSSFLVRLPAESQIK